MNTPLPAYLCLSLHNFPVQSTLRLNQKQLRNKAFALFNAASHLREIIAVNDLAATRGTTTGMSYVQAQLIQDVTLIPYAEADTAATKSAVLSVCQKFTPSIEDCSDTTDCTLVLDITGMRQLFNDLESIAGNLSRSLSSLGLASTSVTSHNFHTARLLATSFRSGRHIYVPAGEENQYLAHVPITALPLTESQHELFENWGLKTLEDVSRLPLQEMVSRMGEPVIYLHEMARGCHPHNFVPTHFPVVFKEAFVYDAPVDLLESLLFSIGAMLRQLILRAESEVQSIAWLTLDLSLDNHSTYRRIIRPGTPTLSHNIFLKLVQLDLESNPPSCSVIGLTMTAQLAQSRTIQLGMFSPQLPEQSQLEMTMARITSIVGPLNAGSPILDNSHRQRTYSTKSFPPDHAVLQTRSTLIHQLSIRRVCNSISMRASESGVPISFIYGPDPYRVKGAYGPWSTTGEWWGEACWNLTQWDVSAERANATGYLYCCVSFNRQSGHWAMDGIYD